MDMIFAAVQWYNAPLRMTKPTGNASQPMGQALSGKAFTQYGAGWGLRLKTEPKAHSNAMSLRRQRRA